MKVIKLFFIISCLIFCLSAGKIHEIDINNFENKINSSEEVWILEIGSKMCGSCTEFFPEYESVAKEMESVNFGMTNIDNSPGMNLIGSFEGVMDEGVPVVLIFDKIGRKWNQIVSGKVVKRKELKNLISHNLKDNKKSNGKYLKKTINEDL